MKHTDQAQHEHYAVHPFDVELFTLRVQERFFGPGYHYKHVSNQHEVAEFLDAVSMKGLRSVGLISLDKAVLPSDGGRTACFAYENVLHELISNDEEYSAHWLTVACHYDLLVIDATAELLRSQWFEIMEVRLRESGVDKNLPVIFLFRS